MGPLVRAPLGISLASAVFSAACAPLGPLPPRTPEIPLAPWEEALSPQRREAPGEAFAPENERPLLAKTAPIPGEKAPPGPASTVRTASSPIVGGAACVAELAARGVGFQRSEPVLGVTTPVIVNEPVAGVRFYSAEKKPFVLDCRLALALHEIAPDLRALGIVEARYSGAYVYRTSHAGRMSLHAYGLAIDLHEFKVSGGAGLLVKKAFARARGCGSDLPLLNELACRVRERRLFHEQIGPDDNADHYDHFHWGLRPLPNEVTADLPWPAPPPRRRMKRVAKQHPGSLPEVAPNGTRNVSAKARSAPARRAR